MSNLAGKHVDKRLVRLQLWRVHKVVKRLDGLPDKVVLQDIRVGLVQDRGQSLEVFGRRHNDAGDIKVFGCQGR